MTTVNDYLTEETAWCPGCGNFSIRRAFAGAMVDMSLEPHQLMVVSGIGQAAKFPHYITCNTFNGLHGRTLPVATGIKLANNRMTVVCETGDGDCYGEGGNHLIHAMRRNIGVKLFVHDNQVYGLTKGQASPTSLEGMVTKVQPFGVLAERFNPLAMAVALDCSFVARGSSVDMDHLKHLFIAAMKHDGFCLVDILQPCVSFNPVNTWDWYRERVYIIEDDYDDGDRFAAFEKSLEWGERIPLGIIYRNSRPTYEDQIPVIAEEPLIDKVYDRGKVEGRLEDFF